MMDQFKKTWLGAGVDFVIIPILSADHCRRILVPQRIPIIVATKGRLFLSGSEIASLINLNLHVSMGGAYARKVAERHSRKVWPGIDLQSFTWKEKTKRGRSSWISDNCHRSRRFKGMPWAGWRGQRDWLRARQNASSESSLIPREGLVKF